MELVTSPRFPGKIHVVVTQENMESYFYFGTPWNGKAKETEKGKEQGIQRSGRERRGMPWRRRLRRKREAVERQVPAGRDDEAVILDVEPADGVVLDEGGPDAGACEELQEVELIGLRDDETDVGEAVKMPAGRAGRVEGLARENSAVLGVMRMSCLADAGTWRECVFSAGASDASAKSSSSAAPSAPVPLDASEVPLEERKRVGGDGDLVGRQEGVGESPARVEQALQLDGAGRGPLARHDPHLRIQEEIRDGVWHGEATGPKRVPNLALRFSQFLGRSLITGRAND